MLFAFIKLKGKDRLTNDAKLLSVFYKVELFSLLINYCRMNLIPSINFILSLAKVFVGFNIRLINDLSKTNSNQVEGGKLFLAESLSCPQFLALFFR